MNEQSVFIIKPEAIAVCAEILEMIKEGGLRIKLSYCTPLEEWVIEKLYPNLTEDLYLATKTHMGGKLCHIGIVEGENAVEKLLTLCGKSTNPNQCAHGSLRKKFASSSAHWTGIGDYWYNVIHRPKNKDEAARDLKIVMALLEGRRY